jgi:hypothetical protein
MRKLRLVVARAPHAVSVLVTAGLVSCGSKSGLFDTTSADGGGAGGTGGTGGIATGGAGGSGGTGGSGGISLGGFGGVGGSGGMGGGPEDCPPFGGTHTYEVEVPPPGVLAIPGQICAVMSEPVESNTSARVTLMKLASLEQASGVIAVAPDIEASIVGVPSVTVIDATIDLLKEMQASALVPVPGGFTFDASWPNPLPIIPDGFARMTVEVAFEIVCDATTGETRKVTSITHVHLCLDETGHSEWASSGDECTVCDIIAEMAPSPIVPDAAHDDLPLARALRLRVVPLARIGKSLVLLAENDGGDGSEYEWHPSNGTLRALEPDIVLWTPEDDDAFIQAAVATSTAMAVASYSLREAS